MKCNPQKGQAILLVVVAMGLFLFGALALALDVTQWFAHHQMAQVAADAAAQAAMLSIFQGVNNATTNPTTYFPTSAPFPCSAHPDSTPCKYVAMNGFGNDTVTVSFPACIPSANAGCASFTPNSVQVTITRSVRNSFIRMIGGPAANSISATGIAAAVTILAPIPLLILHPTMGGSLVGDSNTTILIKGGPSKSIQVNSSDSQAIGLNNKFPLVDLSLAYLGTGADFGVFGGPVGPNLPVATWKGFVNSSPPGTGKYQQPASPLQDPLCLSGVPATCNVAAPTAAEIASLPIRTAPFTGACSPNCGSSFDDAGGWAPECQLKGCDMYKPGFYANGILIGSNPGATKTAIFQPGLYVMGNGSNGFSVPNNSNAYICGGLRTSPNVLQPVANCFEDTATGDGMIVYNQGGGLFSIIGGANARLQGTPEYTVDASGNLIVSRYAGILFFQDRNSPPTGNGSNQHNIGGSGTLALQGTVYITNTTSTILGSAGTHFQQVNYHGGPCTNTFSLGMIIVDALSLSGGGCVYMTLDTASYLKVEQVALVGGGPHF